MRPDLGRKLSNAGKELIAQRCAKAPDLQIVIGDGFSLSATPQCRSKFPLCFHFYGSTLELMDGSMGVSFAVRYCRVGIMNDIGDVLAPRVLVLLIGERPGLATAESLSAYMAYCPVSGHTDANRNLISNIHARGVCVEDASGAHRESGVTHDGVETEWHDPQGRGRAVSVLDRGARYIVSLRRGVE